VVVPGILLCLLLPAEWIAPGIAAVISIGGTVQLAVAVVLLRRRIGPLLDPHLAATLRRLVIAGVPALLVGIGVLAALGGFGGSWIVGTRLGGAAGAVVVGSACLLVYLAVMAALRAPEIGLVTGLVRARIRR
jgi:putative peptidoglycan lipid II flippase